MQKIKKISAILLAVMLWFVTAIPVYAATNTQNGVEITINTDLQKYSSNQKITAAITVKNTNAFPVEDVTLDGIAPAGYQLAESIGPKTVASLGQNESVTLTVTFAPAAAGVTATGDSSNMMLWSVLLMVALAGTTALGIIYRKNRKGFLSIILCLMMLASLLPMNSMQVSAANPNPSQTLSAYETVEVGGQKVKVEGLITYKFPSSADDAAESDQTTAPDSSNTPGSGNEGSNTPGGDSESGGNEGGSDTPGGDGESGNDTPGGDEGGSGSESAYPDNLLTGNWGFENDLADWNPANLKTWTVTADKEYCRTGTGSVLLSVTKENAQAASVTMAYGGTREALKADTEYTLMAWVRTVEPLQTTVADGDAGIQVYFNSSDTTATKYNISQPAVADTEGMWQRVSVNFTTKSDVETPTGNVYLRFKEGTYGSIYVDDVALYETAKVDFTAPDKEAGITNGDNTGSGESGSGDTGSGDSGSDDSGSGTTPDYPENLLTGNGGFEDELADWNADKLTNWTVTANGDSKRTGIGSALLTAPAENAPAASVTMTYAGTRETLKPNTQYTLMAWVRTEKGNPLQTTITDGEAGIAVYFNSSDTVETKYNISKPAVADTEGMWQRISVNFTTKADVATPTGTIYLRMKEGTYGTVYVDDVALYETADVNFDAPDKEVDASTAYPDNLLTGNQGFEDDLKDWNDSGLKSWVVKADKEYSRTGTGSALLTVTKENAQAAAVTMAYSGTKAALKAGTEYTMMAWVRTVEPLQTTVADGEAGIQVYFQSNDTTVTKYNISKPAVADTEGMWQRVSVNFTTKSDVETPLSNIYLRFKEGTYGSIYVDDVGLYETAKINFDAPDKEADKGKMEPSGDSGSGSEEEDVELVPIGENLFTNGSFEEVNPDGSPAGGWAAYGGTWTDMVQVVDGGYDGEKSVRIKTDNTEANPWLYKLDATVVGGEEYYVSVWLKTIDLKGSGPRLKIEFYNEAGENFLSSQSEMFGNTNGEWQKKSCTFTAPAEATWVKVYMRLYNAGEIYYDLAEMYKCGEADKITFDSDTFFYTEWEEGTAGVRLNTLAMEATGEEVFDITLKDAETGEVLKSETGVAATAIDSATGAVTAAKPNFTFDLDLLATKGKEYVVEAKLYDKAGGNLLETNEWPIYRYDRPSMINDDGEIVMNGEVITPVWGYHVFSSDANLKYAKAAGVNVIQGGGASAVTAKEYLDLAQANGMYATVILYSGMKAAGSEGQQNNTLEIINAVKDHPALFGYLVMDEPYLHMSDPYEDLVTSYKMIRDLDTVHPILIQDVEATGTTKYTAATSDILVMHHYACNIKMMPTATEALDTETNYGMEGTTKVIRRMMDDFADTPVKRKVVHYLGQSFGAATREEATGYYLPTIDEAKSMIYQALMEGMEGVGYYSFQETGWHIKDTPIYEGLTAFAENELPIATEAYIGDMHKAAADKTYTILNEYRAIGEGYSTAVSDSEAVWYSIFKENKEDGDWYVIAMNMSEGEKSATIALTSKDGSESLGAYTGILMDGATNPVTVEGNGSLTITLAAHGTAMYKLTGAEPEPQGPINLLTGNVGFEEGSTTGWSNGTGWSFSCDSNVKNSGNYSGLLTATKEQSNTSNKNLAIAYTYDWQPDTEYVFSARVRIDGELLAASESVTDQGIMLRVTPTAASNSNNYGTRITTTDNEWTQLTVTFTTKSDVTANSVGLYIMFKGNTYGTVNIDDVTLYKKADLEANQ